MGWSRCFEKDNEAMLERIESKGLYEKHIASYWSKNFHLYNSKTEIKVAHQYKDTYVVCRECGNKFFFSAKSQKQYDSKNWNWPRRCKSCREARDMRYVMYSHF